MGATVERRVAPFRWRVTLLVPPIPLWESVLLVFSHACTHDTTHLPPVLKAEPVGTIDPSLPCFYGYRIHPNADEATGDPGRLSVRDLFL